MTTNVTYGVDAGVIQTYLPGIPIDANALLTSARLTTLIAHAAAQVNGVLLSAGFVPSDIAADATTVGYLNCQRLVAVLTLPAVLDALQMSAVPAQIKALLDRAHKDLAMVETHPTRLGFADNTIAPAASSHIDILGLPTDAASRDKRRAWTTHDATTGAKKVFW